MTEKVNAEALICGAGAAGPHHSARAGACGDLIDDDGHFRDADGLSPGDWLLVRPDGYVGAIFAAVETAALERYLANVGLGVEGSAHG